MTRILFRRLLGLLLAVVCFASTSFSARQDKAGLSASDEAALRAVVEQFYAAQEKKEITALLKLWSERSPQYGEFKQSRERLPAGAQTVRYAKPAVLRARIVGEGVELRTSVEFTGTAAGAETERLVRDFIMMKEGEEWKVWRYESPAKKLAANLAKVESGTERAALLAERRELETPELVREMNGQAMSLSKQGNHNLALELLRAAKEIAERIGGRREVSLALNNIGLVYDGQHEYVQALEYFHKSLTLMEVLGDKDGRARTLHTIGNVHYSQQTYAQALEYYQKSLVLYEELGNKGGRVSMLNSIGTVYSLQGNYAQALEYYQKGLALVEEMDNKAGRADNLTKIGSVYRDQGNYAQALEYFQKSLALYEELGDKAGRAQSLTKIGFTLTSQGSYPQAIRYYLKGLALYEELGDKTGVADTSASIGEIHSDQGDYEQALEYFQKSLALYEKLGNKVYRDSILMKIGEIYGAQDNYGLALEYLQRCLAFARDREDKNIRVQALNIIGSVYITQGNTTQALEHLQESLGLVKELGNKFLHQLTLGYIGGVYRSQGNFAEALGYYQKRLALVEELDHKALRANVLLGIGIVYGSQGNYAQAIEHFQKSLALAEELGYKVGRVAALHSIGEAHNLQGDYEKALEYFRICHKFAGEMGDNHGIAVTLEGIGDVFSSLGNYSQALEYYQRGIALTEKLGDKSGIAQVQGKIGNIHLSQGNYAQALEHAQRSAKLASQIGNHPTLWSVQLITGRAHRGLDQPDRARKAILEAIATIESIRTQTAGGEQEQHRSFESHVAPYLELADLLAAEGNTANALETIERAKARVLLDVLQAGRVNITNAMSPAEQEQEREFNLRLVELNKQATREMSHPQPDDKRLKEINDHLDKTRLEYEDFRTRLYAAHTELKVRRGEAPPLTARDFGQLLPDNQTALLEFAISEQQVSLFVLTRSSRSTEAKVKRYPLTIKPKELATDAERFREMLEKKDLLFTQLASKLYQYLLQPAAAQLRGKRTLVIVPDGPLWELPFQALKTPTKRYLLQDHVIFYAPSLSALREMSRRRPTSQSAPTLLALGNPALGVPGKGRAAVLMGERLEPLPDAERQVKELKRLYGAARSKVYFGADAREERFKSEANSYSILHLAAHGILNDRALMYSHLVLAQGGEGSKEDGVLEAREIVELDLKADLAVLSACETARGRVSAGEGMIGLTWALFVAGVPRTVVSQWKVESDSTFELMVEFHRQFKVQGARGGAAEALRKASLKLLRGNQYNHPFHWAGFIVIGDGF